MIYNIPKEYNNQAGIYSLTSKIDDRIYIGSTEKFWNRYLKHQRELRSGIHGNRYLVNFYKKHGENSLAMELQELCNKEILLDKEQYWIDKLKPNFNISPSAYNTTGILRSDEFKEKCRRRMDGFSQSEERKKKISETLKYLYETGIRKPVRIAPIIKVVCPTCGKEFETKVYKNRTISHCSRECRYKDPINIQRGRELFSKTHIPGPDHIRSKPVIQLTKDNQFINRFYSIQDAANNLNVIHSAIAACCNGVSQTSYGFRWMFENEYRKNCQQASV